MGQKEKQKNNGFNLSVNTDKKYTDEMDNVSLFQNVRQPIISSGEITPEIKKLAYETHI